MNWQCNTYLLELLIIYDYMSLVVGDIENIRSLYHLVIALAIHMDHAMVILVTSLMGRGK